MSVGRELLARQFAHSAAHNAVGDAMDATTISTGALVIAALSFVVAALSLVLTYTWRQAHSPQLSMDVELAKQTERGIAFLLTFRNKGRYPRSIEEISLVTTGGARVWCTNEVDEPVQPFEVTDKKPEYELFPLMYYLTRGEMRDPMDVRFIEARTTTGKMCRQPRHPWNRRAFIRRIAAQWTQADRAYWEGKQKEYDATGDREGARRRLDSL